MKTADSFNSLRVASPCPMSWEKMNGDDRVRHCDLCDLQVYNISQMSRKEATLLLATGNGRVCGRLFRRADGTIITRDCPVGLRAIRRQVAKRAGAVFAAIMTLCAIVSGQKPSRAAKGACEPPVKITRKLSDAQPASTMALVIRDVNGALVAGANVEIIASLEQSEIGPLKIGRTRHRTSSDEGRVEFAGLAPGLYDLKVESPGFRNLVVEKVNVGAKESIAVEVNLAATDVTVTVGLFGEPALIDKPSGMTVISGDLIRKLPY